MPAISEHKVFLKIAEQIATMSYAKRKRVGAVLVNNGRIISTGYNGMPSGLSNECEHEVEGDELAFLNHSTTKPEVIHAEANAIVFAAKNGVATNQSTLYLTLSPCIECTKLIIQAGIMYVYYGEEYRNTDGLSLLEEAKVHYEYINLIQ